MLREAFHSHEHLRGGSDGADRDIEVRRQKMVARREKVFEKILWMEMILQDYFLLEITPIPHKQT